MIFIQMETLGRIRVPYFYIKYLVAYWFKLLKATEAPSPLLTTDRLYGFDTLRAVAVLLVVALHAAVPYISTPMPGLLWVTEEPEGAAWLNGLFWGIACFIMPLFFCISGYFSWLLYQRRSARQFLSHRVNRILIPLCVAVVVVLPVEVYVWTLSMILNKGYPLKTFSRLNFRGDVRSQFWGLSHLWYLQYLFLYSVMFVLFERYCSHRFAPLQTIYQLVTSRWMPLFLVIPCGLILYFSPETLIGFQHSPLPVLAKFLYNGFFFAIGVIAAHNGKTLGVWKHNAFAFIGCGALLLPGMLLLIQQHVTTEISNFRLMALVAVASLFSCVMTFGCIGLAQKQQRPAYRAVGYLSESSFFLYLIHHPIVAILHLSLQGVSLTVNVKFMIVACSATTFSLLLYHVGVRRTWIGVLLGGRKIETPQMPQNESDSSSQQIKAA